jgi:hypothetical protein
MDNNRSNDTSNHEMESVNGYPYEGRSNPGDLELRNLETDSAHGVPADAPRNFDGIGGTATLPYPEGLDHLSNLQSLHNKDAGCHGTPFISFNFFDTCSFYQEFGQVQIPTPLIVDDTMASSRPMNHYTTTCSHQWL